MFINFSNFTLLKTREFVEYLDKNFSEMQILQSNSNQISNQVTTNFDSANKILKQ